MSLVAAVCLVVALAGLVVLALCAIDVFGRVRSLGHVVSHAAERIAEASERAQEAADAGHRAQALRREAEALDSER